MRSEQVKKDFIKYMEEHTQERFWQSVRNFSGYGFILATDNIDGGESFDTFHWEGLAEEHEDATS